MSSALWRCLIDGFNYLFICTVVHRLLSPHLNFILHFIWLYTSWNLHRLWDFKAAVCNLYSSNLSHGNISSLEYTSLQGCCFFFFFFIITGLGTLFRIYTLIFNSDSTSACLFNVHDCSKMSFNSNSKCLHTIVPVVVMKSLQGWNQFTPDIF